MASSTARLICVGIAFGIASFASAPVCASNEVPEDLRGRVKSRLQMTSEEDDLDSGRVIRKTSTSLYVRFSQTYKGLPVIGGGALATLEGSDELTVLDQTLRPLNVDDLSTIEATAAATSIAEAESLAVGRWETISETLAILHHSIFKTLGPADRLVWDVQIVETAKSGLAREIRGYVDAKTGELLAHSQTSHPLEPPE